MRLKMCAPQMCQTALSDAKDAGVQASGAGVGGWVEVWIATVDLGWLGETVGVRVCMCVCS